MNNTLLESLIHDTKINRWFKLLHLLEYSHNLTGQELSKKLRVTERTILSDLNSLKKIFKSVINILSDGSGYFIKMLDSSMYYKTKQELLKNQKLFLFVNELFFDTKLSKSEWKTFLKVEKLHKYCKPLFQKLKEYDLKLITVNKIYKLEGSEVNIRNFFYDFYFTLDVEPEFITLTKNKLFNKMRKMSVICKEFISPRKLKQWQMIVDQRIRLNYFIPASEKLRLKSVKFHDSIWYDKGSLYPLQESCYLFLMSFNEEILIQPIIHPKGIPPFICKALTLEIMRSYKNYSDVTIESFSLMYMYTYFLDTFRLIPPTREIENKQLLSSKLSKEANEYLASLISQFQRKYEDWKETITIRYILHGPTVLQKWIRSEIRRYANDSDLTLYDQSDETNFIYPLPHVIITNYPLWIENVEIIELPNFPTPQDLKQVCQLLKSLNK
ncbi:HTH domain-containing protein [Enterococcus raffinosus]|uniref:HTH domain-containing protein n=1 Tax=Enterococcus raffinosus TaxID=71452 RepID=A0AAW8TAV7_9ENTE|nr:HTH domain-containing protein [Enterococcus raffinosus]MDT2521715.1 HTH domain-containing protein [Enterococcus raffinosus]MDT2531986.1 HTH domain-containing protein [Enterococcus raffinosus]MDT2532770.1 HTH domain-containing protein [Enterococcus raffinosus]MDT2545511.1 HTH domain-containing protein [Enterococcus raffinosus]MDT2554653.1 HTH domain-containing protein [Enterococcus raffinosus]